MIGKSSISDWIQCLRIKHWVKNGLVFAALVFSKNLLNPAMVARVSLAFLLFGGIASSVYLLNDLLDLEEDKRHPYKSKRAIPSGRIKPCCALGVSILLAIVSMAGAFFMGFWFGVVIFLYYVVNLLYTKYLKHMVIMDVFCVASGFVLRVLAGGLVIHVGLSTWLLICTGLLALFLSFSKRRYELVFLGDESTRHRKVLLEYSPYFLDQMIAIVTSATLIAYILYTISEETVRKFGTNKLILTTPFVLYGIFRYLYLVHQKKEGGDPTRLLLTDIPILIDIALWVICVASILYLQKSI